MRRNATESLIRWKSSANRKPLVLKGARQVSSKGIPLSELLPQFQELLIKLREVEINDTAKKRMDRLIGGSIVFKDEPDDDEEE